jgi:hypothetical protein
MALTLDPCVDSDRDCTGSGTAISEQGTADADAGHADLCSPFCTCNCCSVSMEVASILILPVTSVHYSILPCFFEPQPVSVFYPPVWEPPKA